MLRDWPAVSRNLAFAATFARRFLGFSPEDRVVLLDASAVELIPARMAWDLALALCQARELVRLLEDAEEAWTSSLKEKRQDTDAQC